MDSPRSGFRQARATSWALVGVAIAGVTGTSTLAYADTIKPPATPITIEPVVLQPNPLPAPESVQAQSPVPTTTDPVVPEPTIVEQAPATRQTSKPDNQYAPHYDAQPTEPAPAPSTTGSRAPTTPPTTKRRSPTPTTVMAPNYSPRITMSRGS